MAEAQGIKQISFVDAVDRASEAVVELLIFKEIIFQRQIQKQVRDQV